MSVFSKVMLHLLNAHVSVRKVFQVEEVNDIALLQHTVHKYSKPDKNLCSKSKSWSLIRKLNILSSVRFKMSKEIEAINCGKTLPQNSAIL